MTIEYLVRKNKSSRQWYEVLYLLLFKIFNSKLTVSTLLSWKSHHNSMQNFSLGTSINHVRLFGGEGGASIGKVNTGLYGEKRGWSKISWDQWTSPVFVVNKACQGKKLGPYNSKNNKTFRATQIYRGPGTFREILLQSCKMYRFSKPSTGVFVVF